MMSVEDDARVNVARTYVVKRNPKNWRIFIGFNSHRRRVAKTGGPKAAFLEKDVWRVRLAAGKVQRSVNLAGVLSSYAIVFSDVYNRCDAMEGKTSGVRESSPKPALAKDQKDRVDC